MLFPTVLLCLQVVIRSFEPFLSDFEEDLRFLHLEGGRVMWKANTLVRFFDN